LIIVGIAAGDAQKQMSKKGDVTYTTFGLAVSRSKEQATFFPVTLFGEPASFAK
jgi:hypothetical protein